MTQIISPILLVLLLAIPNLIFSQSCECTNCNAVAPAGTVTDFDFLLSGATNDLLSNPDQGVCGVYIEFAPDHIWSLEMTLISPSGQQINLIGTPTFGGFFSGSLTWGITFLPCSQTVFPDAGFSPVWNNNQPWTIGSAYDGSYYPHSGCLEDFNTGTVNGTWTLSVNNTSFFNVATIYDFKVILCDQDGLDCFPCDADAGTIKQYPDIVACPGDPALEIHMTPDYDGNTPPDPMEYGYTYIVAQNDTILGYDTLPDLTAFTSGVYTVCGMSYLLEDKNDIPGPDGSLTIAELIAGFSGIIPPFCGDITTDCRQVSIIALDTTFVSETICVDRVFTYEGKDYDTTGVYFVHLSATNTICDSIIALDLTVLDSIHTQVNDTICNGEEYCVGLECFRNKGTYDILLQSVQAPFCDSLVTLNLVVKDSPLRQLDSTICRGDSAVVRGEAFYTTGIHYSFPDPNIPCDTLIELKLEVLEPVYSAQLDTLCAGDTLWLGNEFFYETGVFQVTLSSAFGCDSIIRLDLLVLDPLITPLNETICAGDTLWVGNQPFFNDGYYEVNLNSIRQCDSLVQLQLEVRDSIKTFISQTLCEGETLSVGPYDLDATGMYDIVIPSSVGCDSLVQVDLEVFEHVTVNIDSTICRGESVQIGTREYNDTGNYLTPLSTVHGCDSLVRLNLTVLDPIAIIDPVDLLACNNNPVRLDASNSSGNNLLYEWIDLDNGGSGIVSGTNDPIAYVNQAGTYQLNLTDTLNGRSCSATTFVGVGGNLNPPAVFAFGDTLSCKDTLIQINAVVLASDLRFEWTGPGTFTSDELQPQVNVPGDYTLVTTGSNQCKDTVTITMVGDFAPPIVSASVTDTLDCVTDLVPLTGMSADASDSYQWTGPGTFSSTLSTTFAGVPGSYVFTATASNGCTADTLVEVLIDTLSPQATVMGDTLSCKESIGQLTTSSSTTDLEYSWTGPNFFNATIPNPSVDTPGNYDLVITAGNGCTAAYSTVVYADTLAPDLILHTDTLTCTNTLAMLEAISTTSGLQYSWSGPNLFNATFSNPTTSTAGNYYLTVTAANGCQMMDSLVVPLDTLSPTILAMGNTLDCQTTVVRIFGSSSTVDATYSWTGPGSYVSTEQNPDVGVAGAYVLTVTAPNGCIAIDTAFVDEDGDLPGVDALGDTLTCLNPFAQLQGSSPTSGVTYLWTGPGTFNTSEQNPNTNTPGTYTLVVTAPNGCESQTMVTVLDDRMPPMIVAEGDTLNCSTDSIQIHGVALSAPVTYSWTGPGSFSSASPDPFVLLPGAYRLLATADNGCTTIDTAWVVEDRNPPDVIAIGDTLTCLLDSIRLLGNSNTPDVTYFWTGPGTFLSTEQTPLVGEPGAYVLTLTAANACTATATAMVLEDTNSPGASALGDTLTCEKDSIQLLGSSTSGIDYSWVGPGTFSANIQNPWVREAGTYYLTVRGANGCESVDTAIVETSIDLPQAFATSPDTLDCSQTSVTLLGDSPTAGVDYFWTGPGTFTSPLQNPLVDKAGRYVLRVTAPNACVSFDTVNVAIDTLAPDVLALGDTLDCSGNAAQLQGNSSVLGVTYLWEGPGIFTSSEQNPLVTEVGTYVLEVRDMDNGCTAKDTAHILEDVNSPGAMALGDTLTCALDTIQLLGDSPTVGVTYSWEGPGMFTSPLQNPMTDLPGTYILTVLASNNCTSKDTVLIVSNVDLPGALAMGDTLSCQNNPIALSGSSPAAGVTYFWEGPGMFTSVEQNPFVNEAGTYILQVTGANGCSSLDTAFVAADLALPGAIAAVDDTLNCDQTTVTLMGDSPNPAVDFFWLGPNFYTSPLQNPDVSTPGEYILVVSGSNACVSMDTVLVAIDTLNPGATAIGDTLDCQNNSVQIFGNSPSSDVQYSWTGPGIYTSVNQNPIVTEPGQYILTVKGSNGCIAQDSVMVLEDENLPGAMAIADTLDCQNDTIQLMGNSPTMGVSYFWVGPGTFASSEQNPTTDLDGAYILFVTGSNGCESQMTIEVIRDTLSPLVSINADTLDCQTDSIQLLTTVGATSPSFQWNGPGGFDSTTPNPFASLAGNYWLTVTAANSCQTVVSIQVEEDRMYPDIQVNTDTLNCTIDTVQLSGNSSTAGVSYQWTGIGGFSSSEQNPLVDIPGEYILNINAPNGCVSIDTIEVVQDTLVPDVLAIGDTLDCQGNGAQLMGITLTPLADFSWQGPGMWTSVDSNPVVFVDGEYVFTVVGPNGCIARDTVQVLEDVNLPGASIIGDTLTCQSDSIQLFGNSPTAGVSYSWTGPNSFISSEQNPMIESPGEYLLVVTAPNACESLESIIIIEDTLSPEITLLADTLTCKTDSVQLSANATVPIMSYQWTGPAAFSSNVPNPFVDIAGSYYLTITGSNFCQTEDSIEVINNSILPDAMALGDTLNCEKDTIVLLGNSSTLGVSYQWSGIGGFNSTEQNPEVAIAGEYILTVLTLEGCMASDTVMVLSDTLSPGALALGDTLDCQNNGAQLQGSSPDTNATYLWTGPGTFNTADPNPIVFDPGAYILMVKGENGCESQDTAIVVEDTNLPGASITGDTLTCGKDSIRILGNSPATGVSYAWTGPSFISDEQNPMIGNPGEYFLTVRGPNGCESQTSIMITQDTLSPGAVAIGDTLDCTFSALQLQGASPSVGVSYYWEGPASFTSNEQNPLVSDLGIYVLTVRGVNDCVSTDTVEVVENIILPGALALGDTLNCAADSVRLLGNSPTSDVSYSWMGPASFSSSEQNPMTALGGTYILSVKSLEGCESFDTTVVLIDTLAPDIQVLGDTLNCRDTTVQLMANSNTSDVLYSWSGPGTFNSNIQNPQVNTPGLYWLEVQATNACIARDSVWVLEDYSLPGAIALGDTLNCLQDTILLQAQTAASSVQFFWSGPGAFSSSEQNPRVDLPGEYFLTITGNNGCYSVDTLLVIEDRNTPGAFTQDDTLNCATDSIQLQANSPSSNVSYSWIGPGVFNSTQQNPDITIPGLYYLEVQGNNGCISSDTALVLGDFATPGAVAIGDTLDCDNPVGQLLGTSPLANVTYSWIGPGAFASNIFNPEVNDPGIYILQVMAPNFCISTDTVLVEEDVALPGAMAEGDTLNCTITTVQLLGNSPTAGVTYSWTGPALFSSTAQNPLVALDGTYTLMVEAPNGCQSLTTTEVVIDTLSPQLMAEGDTLDCNTGEAQLEVFSGTPGVIYSWSGPDNFTSSLADPIVLVAGEYTIVLTAPNTCRDSAVVEVVPEENIPIAEAGEAALLNCNVVEIDLDGSASMGDADLEYQWLDADNTDLGTLAGIKVDSTGWYYLRVTNPSNICSALDSVLVQIDTLSPEAFVNPIGGLSLTCNTTSIVLDATGSIGPGSLSFEWWLDNTPLSTEPNYETTEPGTYLLLATSMENGCKDSVVVEIIQDDEPPLVLIADPEILNCKQETLFLDASASNLGPEYFLQWISNGPPILAGANTATPTIDQPGQYWLWITNTLNGCRDSASVEVFADFDLPTTEAGEGGTLDCHTTSIILNGQGSSEGQDFLYSWMGPEILFGQNDLTAEAGLAGQYFLQVIDTTNGCSTIDSVFVIQGNSGPGAVIATLLPPPCFGETAGEIIIDTIIGGLGPYLYMLDGMPFVSWPQFNQLSAGNYQLTIQDAEGCELDTSFQLQEPLPLGVVLGEDTLVQLGEMVDLAPQVFSARPYDFEWDANKFLTCDSCLAQTVMPLRTAIFVLTVTDENGCVAEDRQTIYVENGDIIFVPSAFSPNGDGTNDLLEIFPSRAVKEIKSFLIFDRWGEVVHERREFFPGDPGKGWDGYFRGRLLNPAVFVYYAEVILLDGSSQLFEGSITLIR